IGARGVEVATTASARAARVLRFRIDHARAEADVPRSSLWLLAFGAAAGATLAIRARLHKVERLRRSLGRLAASNTALRRQIERELHDSTQQRFVALQIELGMILDEA